MIYITLILLSLFNFTYTGFSLNTKVVTPSGLQPISQLQKNNSVISPPYDISNIIFCNQITEQSYITIYTETDSISCDLNQKFLIQRNNKLTFCSAKLLSKEDLLVCSDNNTIPILNIEIYNQQINLYELRINHINHTFCITSQNIIVHNFALCAAGLIPYIIFVEGCIIGLGTIAKNLIFCGSSCTLKEYEPSGWCKLITTVTFEDPDNFDFCDIIIIEREGDYTYCGTGEYLANFEDTFQNYIINIFLGNSIWSGPSLTKLIFNPYELKKQKQFIKQQSDLLNKQNQETNRIYDSSPKHGKKSRPQRGGISKSPQNGQKALDNSVQIKDTSPRRIGIDENGDIVILPRTLDQNGIETYHGFVVQWDELKAEQQKALRKAGLVDEKGKPKK